MKTLTIALLALTVACGTVPAPSASADFVCRTSCTGIVLSPTFLAARKIILAAENHYECNDADVMTRAYAELDGLFDSDFAPTVALGELQSCLRALDDASN